MRGRGDLLSRVSVMRNPASFFALQPAKLWMQSAVAVVMFLLQPNSTVGVGGSTFTVEIGGSIQAALDEVSPGDEVVIKSGHYWEDIETKVDGNPDAKITIRGDGGVSNRDNIVLRGAGDASGIFTVSHDHYIIEDFTIDAQAVDKPEDANFDNYRESYRNTPLDVVGSRAPTTRDGGYLSAIDGLVVRRMSFKNAGGECVRLRYFVTKAEIYDNDILNCGVYDYIFNEGGHNGEGIYVGTSSPFWHANFADEEDMCLGNVVRNNNIVTMANEGVEVKQGCLETLIEGNDISMQQDVSSGGISSAADETIIRYNKIEDADGAGVRLKTRTVDGRQYGINSQVYENTIVNCRAYGVKIEMYPQLQVCGNDIQLPPGINDDEYLYTGGDYSGFYDARRDCDDSPPPSPTPDAELLGCFEDVESARTMAFGYKDIKGLTNQACIDFCRGKKKSFAGTFNGKTCRCTSIESRYSKHGASTRCNKICPGQDDEICGGVWAITTWKV